MQSFFAKVIGSFQTMGNGSNAASPNNDPSSQLIIYDQHIS